MNWLACCVVVADNVRSFTTFTKDGIEDSRRPQARNTNTIYGSQWISVWLYSYTLRSVDVCGAIDCLQPQHWGLLAAVPSIYIYDIYLVGLDVAVINKPSVMMRVSKKHRRIQQAFASLIWNWARVCVLARMGDFQFSSKPLLIW